MDVFNRKSPMKGRQFPTNRSAFSSNDTSSPHFPSLRADVYLCENCGADYESLETVMVNDLKQLSRIL